MDYEIQLHLEKREKDRVFVRIDCKSLNGVVPVDSAKMELKSACGQSLCPQLLIPVSEICTETTSRVFELRAGPTLPQGAVVHAQIWTQEGVRRASCPADPFLRAADHVLGVGRDPEEYGSTVVRALTEEERGDVLRAFPWLDCPRSTSPEAARILEAKEEMPEVDDLMADLGLDEDCAEWLSELLGEDE